MQLGDAPGADAPETGFPPRRGELSVARQKDTPAQTTGRFPQAEWVAQGLRSGPDLDLRDPWHSVAPPDREEQPPKLSSSGHWLPDCRVSWGPPGLGGCSPPKGPCPSARKMEALWPVTDRAVSQARPKGFLGSWSGRARMYHPAVGVAPAGTVPASSARLPACHS